MSTLTSPSSAAHDTWARLDRFLRLGSADGRYTPGEASPMTGQAPVVARCLATDGPHTIDRIVAISTSGRAPKNDPATFSLAMAAKLGDEPTRRAAYAALPAVCRGAAELMGFAAYAQAFGGWGRGMRNAVGAWFNARPAGELARQLAAQPSRDGWSHRDLLRLAHPRAASASHDRLFAWAVRGALPDGAAADPACALPVALDQLRRTTDPVAAARLVRDADIPRACVPAELLRHREVWAALLARMPLGEALRELAAMTRVGLLGPGSDAARELEARLGDRDELAAAGAHPFGLLAARIAYAAGRGRRGQGPWLPVASIVDALDAAMYASVPLVEPIGGRVLLALDVSRSMDTGAVAGVPQLTPRLATAAVALVTAATERDPTVAAFTAAAEGEGGRWGGGTPGLSTVSISPRERLDGVVGALGALPAGGVDCAQPMVWAQKHRVDVDTFVVYTDHETWAGSVHPAQALRAYRDARGIPAKLVVVGMTSSGFSVADPNDAGMLDVVGFDTSTLPVIADFARAQCTA